MKRTILVDDLDGTCHRAWGMLPNMSFITLKGGTIAYKADWTNSYDVARATNGCDVAGALEELLEEIAARTKVPFYNERLRFRDVDREAFMKGLERNGPKAIADFSNE